MDQAEIDAAMLLPEDDPAMDAVLERLRVSDRSGGQGVGMTTRTDAEFRERFEADMLRDDVGGALDYDRIEAIVHKALAGHDGHQEGSFTAARNCEGGGASH